MLYPVSAADPEKVTDFSVSYAALLQLFPHEVAWCMKYIDIFFKYLHFSMNKTFQAEQSAGKSGILVTFLNYRVNKITRNTLFTDLICTWIVKPIIGTNEFILVNGLNNRNLILF